jgi:hypothetical protein
VYKHYGAPPLSDVVVKVHITITVFQGVLGRQAQDTLPLEKAPTKRDFVGRQVANEFVPKWRARHPLVLSGDLGHLHAKLRIAGKLKLVRTENRRPERCGPRCSKNPAGEMRPTTVSESACRDERQNGQTVFTQSNHPPATTTPSNVAPKTA